MINYLKLLSRLNQEGPVGASPIYYQDKKEVFISPLGC